MRQFAITAFVLLIASVGALASDKKQEKDYALIFGTVYDANNHPAQGVVIKIKRVGDKKAKWERVSDSRGEFAQRVPPGQAAYVVRPELKNKQVAEKAQVTVHIQNNERQDISVHLDAKEPLTSK